MSHQLLSVPILLGISFLSASCLGASAAEQATTRSTNEPATELGEEQNERPVDQWR